MGWFQFICKKHEWNSHSKREKKSEEYVQNIMGDGYNPTGITKEFVVEILICKNCGKIKKLK